MNTYAKLAAAAAAILVVAVAGYQLLPDASGPGDPGPTPSPAVTPAPTEVPRLPANGPVVAGTYGMGARNATFPSTFHITVPAGWASTNGVSLGKHREGPTEVWLDTYLSDLRVYADACMSDGTEQAIGPAAEDLVSALKAQLSADVTEPVEERFGSLRATRLDISASDGVDLAGCSNGGLQIWRDSSEPEGNYLAFGPDAPSVVSVYIVDTGTGRIVFTVGHGPSATATDIAELEAIVASIEVAA